MKLNRSITFIAFAAMTALLSLAVSSFAQQTAVSSSETMSTTVAKASSDEGKTTSVEKVAVPSTAKSDKETTSTAAPAAAADGPWDYTDDGKWHWEIRPYLWAAGLNGDLRVRESNFPINADFSDLFGQLDFAMASQFEIGKGKWRFIVDENYMNLGYQFRGANGNVAFDIEPTLNIFEAGAAYRLVAQPHKEDGDSRPPKFSAELLGGMRWIRFDVGITPVGGNEVEGTSDLTGFFVGNRYKFNVARPVTLVGKWTIGTSGVNSNVAGTASAYADIKVSKNMSITGGYNFMNLNADELEKQVGFQGQLKGVFAGFVIHR